MENVTLKELQMSILEIMIEIKRVCEKYNLKYILYGGSCLGAVRHNGFIPWDDDADIAMPRADYERLKKICLEGQLSDKFYFQDYSDSEPHYHSPWIRIRKNNTLCVIDHHEKDGFNHLGVFVDIFPIDYLSSDNEKFVEKKYAAFKKANRLFKNKVSIKRKTIKSKILHLSLLPFSAEKLLKKRDNTMLGRFNNNIKAICLFDYCSSYAPKGALFPVDLFDETINHTFENIEFPIPKKYDDMLKIMYGDYMTLPPENKRVAHMPNKVIL